MKIKVPSTDVEDLRQRLRRSRLPTPVDGYGWEEGADAGYLLDHWGTRYDWREREACRPT